MLSAYFQPHSFTLSQIKSNLFHLEISDRIFYLFLEAQQQVYFKQGSFSPQLSIGEVEIRVNQCLKLLKECQVSKEVKSLLLKNL